MPAPAIPPSAPVPGYLKMPMGINAAWGPNDAPILIVLGQSNAYGHGTNLVNPITPITTGLANVLTLSSAALYNLTFTGVSWGGMTTNGDMNVGTGSGNATGAQSGVCNVANWTGKLWQDHINAGNAMGLPTLHTILFAWGGQGIAPSLDSSGIGRWNPNRTPTNVESLYPRCLKTLRLAIKNLQDAGKTPRIIGVHWNQWESDASTTVSAQNFHTNLTRVIAGVNDALGTQETPWTFYYPQTNNYQEANRAHIRSAILRIVAADPVHRQYFDIGQSPNYNPALTSNGVGGPWGTFGVYATDGVHYTTASQQWFAEKVFASVQAGFRGTPVAQLANSNDAYWLNQRLSDAEASIASLGTGGGSAASTPTTSWYPNQFVAGTWASLSKEAAGFVFKNSASTVGTGEILVQSTGGKKAFKANCLTKGSGTMLTGLAASATPTDGKYGFFEMDIYCEPTPQIAVWIAARTTTDTSVYGNLGYTFLALHLSGAYTGQPQTMPSSVTLGANQAAATPYAVMWVAGDTASGGLQTIPFAGTASAGVYPGTPVVSSAGVWQTGAKTLVTGWPTNTWVRWRVGLTADNNGSLSAEWYDTATSTWKVAIRQQNMNSALTSAKKLDFGQMGLMWGMSSNATTVANQNALYYSPIKDIVFTSQD